MILARNLQQSWEGLCVLVDQGSDLLCDVLVDEKDGNVLTLLCELVEVRLEVGRRCLWDEAIMRMAMLHRQSLDPISNSFGTVQTFESTMAKFLDLPSDSTCPMPARSRPVVVSCEMAAGRAQISIYAPLSTALHPFSALTSSQMDAMSVLLAACCEIDILLMPLLK